MGRNHPLPCREGVEGNKKLALGRHDSLVESIVIILPLILGLILSGLVTAPRIGAALAASQTPDFTVTARPSMVTVYAGQLANSTVVVSSINGFSGMISLQASISSIVGSSTPVNLNPSAFNLNGGENQTSTLTVPTTVQGWFNYTVTVAATSGQLSHSVVIVIQVVSFNIQTWGGATLAVYPGLTVRSGVRLFSYNGFQGNVTLSTSVIPRPVANGPDVTLSRTQLFLPRNGDEGSEVTVSTLTSTPEDSYTITVTATSGSFLSSTTISLTVSSKLTPDFVFIATYTGITVNAGALGQLQLTLISQNGFAGYIRLAGQVSPVLVHGPTVSFSSVNVTLAGSGMASSVLNVQSVFYAPQQTYSLSISATSGTLSHSLQVTLQIIEPLFFLSATPNSLVIQAGDPASALVTPSTLSMSGLVNLSATILPAIPKGPKILLSSTALIVNRVYAEASTLTVYTNASTPLGRYHVNVTGTSYGGVYWIDLNVTVIPQAARGYLFYEVQYVGLPYPGGQTTLLNNFTDRGNVPMRITSLSFATDFGTFNESSGLPLELRPGETRTLGLTMSIPLKTASGNHTIIATVKWEYYDPQTSRWVVSNPVVLSGQLPIALLPPSPPQGPPPKYYPTTKNVPFILRSILSRAMAQVTNLLRGIPTTGGLLLSGVAIYISSLIMAIAIMYHEKRRK